MMWSRTNGIRDDKGEIGSLIILSEKDVKRAVAMKEAIQVMKDAFIQYARGDYVMPARNFYQVEDEDYFLLMSSFVKDVIGLKVATSFPSNRNRNVPVTQAMILLMHRKTGKPLAMMSGTMLTAIKTGAVSGVAIQQFKQDAKSVGLIGTGQQGLYQLLAALESANIKNIYLYNRSEHKIKSFIEQFRRLSNSDVHIEQMGSVEALLDKSEIVITATTSFTPVIPDVPELYQNQDKLFVAVGSFDAAMRELPESLFRSATYYFIDSEDGKKECGDIIDPIRNKWMEEDDVILLSDILTGKRQVHLKSNEPIVFKTVSMALFDTCIGYFVYHKAKELNLGQQVDLSFMN